MLSEFSPRREMSVSAACLPSNTALCRGRVYLGTLNTRNISASLPLVSCLSPALHLSSVIETSVVSFIFSIWRRDFSANICVRRLTHRFVSSATYINEHLRLYVSSTPAALIENDGIAPRLALHDATRRETQCILHGIRRLTDWRVAAFQMSCLLPKLPCVVSVDLGIVRSCSRSRPARVYIQAKATSKPERESLINWQMKDCSRGNHAD